MDTPYSHLKLCVIVRHNEREMTVDPYVLFKGFHDHNMLLDFPVA